MSQIIAENFIVTLLAGALGLLMSVVFAFVGSSMLFAQEFSTSLVTPEVDASMLLQLDTFLWAFFFCFVLNLLSSGVPAWRASRIGIVSAINGKLH
jgi:putative ABC transport system permease protein